MPHGGELWFILQVLVMNATFLRYSDTENLNDEIRNQNSNRLGLNMKLDSTYIVSLAYSDFFFYFLTIATSLMTNRLR